MKVVFFVNPPFALTHGGMQASLRFVMEELNNLGVEAEPERWWDVTQKADIIHYFMRPPIDNVRAAHAKGIKFVTTQTLDVTASRSPRELMLQRLFIKVAKKIVPPGMLVRMGWDVYQELDAIILAAPHEWDVARYLFDATPGRGYIVPFGLQTEALQDLARPQEPGDYIVSMATIYPRKNSVLLAQAAKIAGVPMVFLGKPFGEQDPYYLEFLKQVDGKLIRHIGHVVGEEKNHWLRGARGYALLSKGESVPIAVFEAAAAGLPLFLSDLPWANRVYPGATFARLGSPEAIAPVLRRFYEQSRRQSSPTVPVPTWRQIAAQYLEIYKKILATP